MNFLLQIFVLLCFASSIFSSQPASKQNQAIVLRDKAIASAITARKLSDDRTKNAQSMVAYSSHMMQKNQHQLAVVRKDQALSTNEVNNITKYIQDTELQLQWRRRYFPCPVIITQGDLDYFNWNKKHPEHLQDSHTQSLIASFGQKAAQDEIICSLLAQAKGRLFHANNFLEHLTFDETILLNHNAVYQGIESRMQDLLQHDQAMKLMLQNKLEQIKQEKLKKERSGAALTLQCWARGLQSQEQLRLHTLQNQSAIQGQSVIRGFLARRQAVKLRHQHDEQVCLKKAKLLAEKLAQEQAEQLKLKEERRLEQKQKDKAAYALQVQQNEQAKLKAEQDAKAKIGAQSKADKARAQATRLAVEKKEKKDKEETDWLATQAAAVVEKKRLEDEQTRKENEEAALVVEIEAVRANALKLAEVNERIHAANNNVAGKEDVAQLIGLEKVQENFARLTAEQEEVQQIKDTFASGNVAKSLDGMQNGAAVVVGNSLVLVHTLKQKSQLNQSVSLAMQEKYSLMHQALSTGTEYQKFCSKIAQQTIKFQQQKEELDKNKILTNDQKQKLLEGYIKNTSSFKVKLRLQQYAMAIENEEFATADMLVFLQKLENEFIKDHARSVKEGEKLSWYISLEPELDQKISARYEQLREEFCNQTESNILQLKNIVSIQYENVASEFKVMQNLFDTLKIKPRTAEIDAEMRQQLTEIVKLKKEIEIYQKQCHRYDLMHKRMLIYEKMKLLHGVGGILKTTILSAATDMTILQHSVILPKLLDGKITPLEHKMQTLAQSFVDKGLTPKVAPTVMLALHAAVKPDLENILSEIGLSSADSAVWATLILESTQLFAYNYAHNYIDLDTLNYDLHLKNMRNNMTYSIHYSQAQMNDVTKIQMILTKYFARLLYDKI